MRIFFTGGSGKAGRHVAPYLAEQGHHVTNADLVPLGHPGVADLRVDLSARRVTRGEREIRLTAQEFSLLRILAENAGRVMSRTRLLEKVWDLHRDPRTNVVDVYIQRVRRKIEDAGAEPPIRTRRGEGYQLIA